MICTNRDRRATAAGRLPRSGRPRWIPGERDVATAGRTRGREASSFAYPGRHPAAPVVEPPAAPATSRSKRALDIVLVLVSLPLVLPLGLAIALVVLATSRGPVLFGQEAPALPARQEVFFRTREAEAPLQQELGTGEYVANRPGRSS